ncbi:PREDICTED: U2 snRNP-associated SURP motif-containing protein-like [Acropora digitifera]|uniref:U2 snRNP-associated SURP motif-containing protein-like n=1 Tax=Acropora digitifera TaxID=70779 RepID=UPI00077A5287|nr:PREDICTED: U2 snRNP-associated SURP motif-containing protein-like [Acropora digitifera]
MAAKKADSSEKSLPWGLSPEGLAPGSMKTISQSKLKSFSVGMMNAGLKKPAKSKQDVEEKKKKQEAEAAEVFADFVASFEDSRAAGKTFVRGNTINPETKEETASKQAGALYKPMAKIQTAVIEQKIKTEFSQPKSMEIKKKAKEKEKKKSNLELFKEELKRYQMEREIRHKIKKGDLSEIPKDVLDSMTPSLLAPPKEESYSYGSHDTGDPNTTNLYIGNINPAMTEEMLMRLFGKYGPLASVKIMWPRTEEEKARNRNCGFVAYMRRKDGEKALNALKGKEVMSYEMKLGWGKGVPIPPHPIYIPPEMQEDTTPPPPSGLPFNAQPDNKKKDDYSSAPPPQGGVEDAAHDLDPNGFNKEVSLVLLQIVECIAESLSILETPLQVKVARLYLVSDILHNCSVKVPNVSYYRRGFQKLLPEIFANLSASFKAIIARMKAENFRKQVLRCLAAWMDWAVFTPDFLIELENVFLGHIEKPGQTEAPVQPLRSLYPADESFGKKPDLDGAPLDVDGAPLQAADVDGVPIRSVDIDGVPLTSADIVGVPFSRDGLDGTQMDSKKAADKPRDKDVPLFASKWDRPEWEPSEEPVTAPM